MASIYLTGDDSLNLADKIRELSVYAEPESISEALSIPLDIVKGVLSGEINEEALAQYDPAAAVRMIEKQIITRGRIISVVQYAPLAAEFALYISQHNSVAAIDLELYSTLPLFFGLNISNIPQYSNVLWDEHLDNKPFQENIYIYSLPPGQRDIRPLAKILDTYPTTVINTPIDSIEVAQKLSDMIYLPVYQNQAGVYKIHQILRQNKLLEEKIQIVWITNQDNPQYLSILRQFSNIQVAGYIPDLAQDIKPQKYKRNISKILEPLYPGQRQPKRFIF